MFWRQKMNKKLFSILFIAFFLIASTGFVSAAEDSNDISVNDIGNDQNGFVTTNNLVETPLGESTDDITGDDDDGVATEDDPSDDIQDDSEDEEVDSDDYITDDLPDDDDGTTGLDDSPEVVSAPTKEPTNNTVNKYEKTKLKNTGFPIAGLVLVVFGAAFIPLARKKR